MTTVAPALSVIPPEDIPSLSPVHSSASASTHRLLYRGALSLPDSHLLLDGLSFSARLDSPTTASVNLLRNPLALALESMRGRPSLRFVGSVSMRALERGGAEGWLDESGGVEVQIHPSSTLTRIYFENMFCTTPYSATSRMNACLRSDIGVKVVLGDSGGTDTTKIIIYGRTAPISSSSPSFVQLVVARLSTQPLLRLPRPDDPTPRKPPIQLNGEKSSAISATAHVSIKNFKKNPTGSGLKRVTSGSFMHGADAAKKRQRTIVDLGNTVRLGQDASSRSMPVPFKIPSVNGKGKEREMGLSSDKADPFEDGIFAITSEKNKTIKIINGSICTQEDWEGLNKNAVKKATIDYLARTKDPTGHAMGKTHPEFKEMYSFVYRGVSFALRSEMKGRVIPEDAISRLVATHVHINGCEFQRVNQSLN